MLCLQTQTINQLIEPGFLVIDNFLPPTHFESVRQTALQQQAASQFQQAKIGAQTKVKTNRLIRSDSICWLEHSLQSAGLDFFFKQIDDVQQQLNLHFFLSLVEQEMHFAYYDIGAYYRKHIDQFNDKKTRKISFVFYLNDAWETSYGGQLAIYNDNGALLSAILPQANRFILFRSDLVHEVLTTWQPRLSLTGWLKTRD